MTTADRLQSVTRQLSLMRSERDFWISKARNLSLELTRARSATETWMVRAHKLEDEVTAARAGQDSEREAREMVARTLDSSLTALKLALDDRTRSAMEASRVARLEAAIRSIWDNLCDSHHVLGINLKPFVRKEARIAGVALVEERHA